jgi:hypothetical protein
MPEGIAGGKGEGPDASGRPDGVDIGEMQRQNGERYDIAFTVDAVCATFHVLPELWRDAAFVSTDADNFRVGDLEAIAKNY